MAALKDEMGPAAAARLADELAGAWPAFPRAPFEAGLGAALEPLELSGRVAVLAARLGEALPDDLTEAAQVVRAALASPGFDGWITWPVGMWVAAAGLDQPDLGLALLAELTPRWSSEFAIRPFLEAHPEATYAQLHRWAAHPDEHVRRLASEGSRPRLPWAPVLRSAVADPTAGLEVLEHLHGDESTYVRTSVANHLNDVSRDHPELALATAQRWLPAGERSAWVVRKGLRTLVKRGDPAALALLGIDLDVDVRLQALALEPSRLAVGEAAVVRIELALGPEEAAAKEVVVDYRVHYQGASGPKAPKVFKLTRRTLQPGETVVLERRHAFAHVSIRQIRPGPHTVDVQVNGKVLGSAVLEVTAEAVPPRPPAPRRGRSTPARG